jgi:hypothetical protein
MQRYMLKREEAVSQYRALHGLQDMTQEEIRRRSDDLARAGTQQSGERLSIVTRTRNMFDTAVDRMRDAAERDPAQSVEGGISLPRVGTRRRETIGPDGQPVISGETDIDHRLAPAREVAEARDFIQRRHGRYLTIGTDENGALAIKPIDATLPDAQRRQQEAWRIIMDARMDAEARRGIPERSRSPITKAEAIDLLNMPRTLPRGPEGETQFRNLMRAAVDRAHERYGPYARQALDAAIRFRSNMTSEQSDIATTAVRRMVEGVSLRPEDIERSAQALRVARERQAWEQGLFPSAPPMQPEGRWWQSAPPPAPVPPAVERMFPLPPVTTAPQASGRPGSAVAWPKPAPQDISDLQRYPDLQREFDMRFGSGAAARYLQGAGR